MRRLIGILVIVCMFSCKSQTNSNEMSEHAFTNALINSSSPYLQQHAHNPVNWEEWGAEALEKAKKEDKPILVSIGYSSCHWCHVMEKESFEDTAVASLMNKHFVSIKVDREERPDVDQIYMDAVQAMGINGGWPLNVFLTPDQKPFYGGTYFPNQGWKNLLTSIADAFENNRDKINESAEAFTKNLRLKESEKYKLEGSDYKLNENQLDQVYESLSSKFDRIDGGMKRAPKFPMPAVWNFLTTYYHHTQNQQALDHLNFSLSKIANGGIYDHVGGGFARYSVDEEWHIPHFEKMLYDNGQLLSLYSNAFKVNPNAQYEQVILETVNWMKREMLDESGGFYSALDADSEGEEGKFYVWTAEELEVIAGENYGLLSDFYDIQKSGNWEGKNVLRVVAEKKDLFEKYNLTDSSFDEIIQEFKQSALKKRGERVRPGLDDKIIAGWNGLALSGLSDAYQALNDSTILELATSNAEFIQNNLVRDGILYRFSNKDLEGFLEDYSAVIQGFIKYYETTFDWKYLESAKVLMDRVNEQFYDDSENLYFFSGDDSENLIARKKEFFDNVIPSSNSIMAWNLVHLGTHFYDEKLIARGKSMVAQVLNLFEQEPEYLANWGMLAVELSSSFAEVVIIGDDHVSFAKELNRNFHPNKIVTGSQGPIDSPLFEYKDTSEGETTIFVCYDRSCKRPVTSPSDALLLME